MKLTLIALALCGSCFAAGHSACTTKDVSGTYAFLANGAVLVPGSPISGPFSRVGYFTANGKGAVNFSTLALYNGINFGLENFSGTYSVASDCSIDLHVAVPQPVNANAEFKGQIADDGNDVVFMLINTDDPTKPGISTVAGFGKTRDAGPCSNQSLDGSWRMEINGTNNLPPFGTGTPYRQVGQFQYDGNGGLLANFITSQNGSIFNQAGAGTYSVYSDCTFDLNYTTGATPYSIHGSMITSKEAFLALNMPGPTVPGVGIVTGAVATGNLVQQTKGSPGYSDHGNRGDLDE